MSPFGSVRRVGLFGAVAVGIVAVAALWSRASVDPALTAVVQRGTLTAQLTTSGTLKPIQSLTYRSPIVGREMEIVELAPEGTRISAGGLLVRLDAHQLQRDIDRARQELRQLKLDLQVVHGERQDAEATVRMVAEGEGALTVEEARTRLVLADQKATLLRGELEQLTPLMAKGYITRDELARTQSDLNEAVEELRLARRRASVVEELTHPREKQRAALQLAQKHSQVENVVGRVEEAELRLLELTALVTQCDIRARHPGLVVYEEVMNASPRRKIRIGDRVTPTQGLVTIPEVNRMIVESSVGESEVHRVRPGQTAAIRLEAFPDLRLTGKVSRVGTLATSSLDRPLEDKRFDLVIELDPTDVELRPEMTARADLTIGTRANVVLVPVNAIFEQQGVFVAHVVGVAGVETRPVDLGESNDQFVEVVAGLREHERVMLTEPLAAADGARGEARREAPNRESGNGLQPR